MIAIEQLEKQRHEVERLRLRAEREELHARLAAAKVARRRAELEAVTLGLRRECARGCGRPLHRTTQSDTCIQCRKADGMRRARAGGVAHLRSVR